MRCASTGICLSNILRNDPIQAAVEEVDVTEAGMLGVEQTQCAVHQAYRTTLPNNLLEAVHRHPHPLLGYSFSMLSWFSPS